MQLGKTKRLGILPKVIIAIVCGIGCGFIFPDWAIRIFSTINSIFGNFLTFIIPLLIFGLITPGISDIGKQAGKLLLLTVAIAYTFTVCTGLGTFFSSSLLYPILLTPSPNLGATLSSIKEFPSYFTIDMPPLFSVNTALILSFVVGISIGFIHGNTLKNAINEFRNIINKVIIGFIIPFLPLYIFGIFLNMTATNQIGGIINVFSKVIIIIFIMTLILLLIQFGIAGAIAKKNPFRLFKRMIPAYMTALGTQSSAATIPVTLKQTLQNDVDEDIASFVVPLCATIHLSGSTMKIVACALAILFINNVPFDYGTIIGFIFALGVTMIAAPGVPGGAIIAAMGLLESSLGFDATAQGLMVALYIAMDSFGTATNVTGDGAIAVIIDSIYKHRKTLFTK